MNDDTSETNPEITNGEKQSSSLWFPIILIAAGVFFLLRQVINFSLDNWWALFILIPVLSAWGGAYRLWQSGGRITFGVWSAFYGGLFPLLVTLIFLFNLDWGDYWPAFIIIGGIGMMVGGFSPQQPEFEGAPRVVLNLRPWAIFIGLAGSLLGVTFLAFNLEWIQTFPFLDVENWWSLFIILASLGGLVTAILLIAGGQPAFLVALNLFAFGLIAFTGIVALFRLDWNLINSAFPVLLILGGLWMIFGRRVKIE